MPRTRMSFGLEPTDCVLEDEVIKNGFERVLKTRDGKSISEIVNDKLQHPRHQAMVKDDSENELCYDEMLAGKNNLKHFLVPDSSLKNSSINKSRNSRWSKSQ